MGKDKHSDRSGREKHRKREDKKKPIMEFEESSEDEEHVKKLKQVAHGKKVDDPVIDEIVAEVEGKSASSASGSESGSSDDELGSGSSGSDSDSDSSGSGSDGDEDDSDDDDAVSLSTTEILNSDPLYTILSQFFVTKEGKNIAEILEEINHKLKYLKVR